MKRMILALSLLLALSLPAQADGWFPQINSRGEITSGFGTIEAAGKVIGAGHGSHWLTDDTILYGTDAGMVTLNLRTGEQHLVPGGYNFVSAGGNTWLGTIAVPPIPTHRYVGVQRVAEYIGAGVPMVAPNGRYGYVTPYADAQRTIVVNDVSVVSGTVMDAALTETAVVYSVATGMYTREVYYILGSAAPQRATIFNWESPSACDGAGATWILSVTQAGLAFRPAGSGDGFYWRGEFFNPSCRYVNGEFIIASSNSHGVLQVMNVKGAGAVHYANITDDGVNLTPAPPAPAPVTPPVVAPAPPQASPDKAVAGRIVREERAKYPTPMSEAQIATLLKDVARRMNSEGLAGGPFGALRKSGGNACAGYSCDIICTGNGSAQRQWDILGNADPAERGAGAGDQRPDFGDALPEIAVRDCEIQSGAVTGPPTPAPLPSEDPSIAVLRADVARLTAEVAQLNATHTADWEHIADLDARLIESEKNLDDTRKERDALKNAPEPSCVAKVPSYLKSLGIKVGCSIVH
jgi:hypothetical protein